MATLDLKQINKSFGSAKVLHDIDLAIQDKEFVVFVGPSGCGKSTLLRIIAGLEELTTGQIIIDGQDVSGAHPVERGISMVFQSYALYPHLSVYENIAFPLRVQKVEAAELKRRVERAAGILQLMDKLHLKPGQLSGGQRQRVAIGRSIVRNPKVFLFDEPLSNLDAALRGDMRVELSQLHRELDATMVYVTHDQIEAMTLADRVVVMSAGVVQQVGSPTDIYDNPANTFVASFIGSPAMNLLEGTIEGGTFTGKDVKITGLHSTLSGPVTLGYRAEDASIGGDAPSVNAPVYSMELLGDATMVTFRIAGAIATVKADKDFRAKIGETVAATIPAATCHLFDATSGERL